MNQSNRPFSGLRAPASARALILTLAVSALFPSAASAADNESPAADKAAAASSEAPLAGAASSDASQVASASQAQAGESAPLSQAEIQAAIRAQLPGAASTPPAVSEPSGSHVARKEFKLPGTHWVNQHLDFVHPRNSAIATGSAPSTLETASVDLSGVSVTDGNGNAVTLADYQNRGDVDSLLVLHRGQIVYEHYAHGMIEERRHALWSMTKSFTGLIATDLIQSGQLDPSAPVTQYVPELQGSAWDGASVQQTLDMTTAVDYAERPDADPGVVQYMFAADLLNVGPLYQGPKKIID
ncbi:MAG: class A beta-lactamase-related serine hydrolase, partial [Lautropia sp.]